MSLTPSDVDAARLRLKEEEAWTELVRESLPSVYRLARRLTDDESEAVNLTRLTFRTAVQSLRSLSSKTDPSLWLFRVLVSLWREARGGRRKLMSTLLRRGRRVRKGTAKERVITPGLQGVVRRLPVESQVLVVLKDMEKLSYDEMAQILGWNVQRVKDRMGHAHYALHEMRARTAAYR